MAFENIDVVSLKSALNQCENSINYSMTEDLINNISNTSVWQSESQPKLKIALEILKNERYKELKNKIRQYLIATSYIEKYKMLEMENKLLYAQYSALAAQLYKEETYQVISGYDADGNPVVTEAKRRVIDPAVQAEMSSVMNKINENKRNMENLEAQVANLI